MIDICNGAGLSLVLQAEQNLLIEQSVGWLTDDVLPGAFSYPIGFPIAPNEAFLQSGYRPEAARPRMEVEVTVRLSGVLYRRCMLEYKVDAGVGSGFLKIDGGEVNNRLRGLTLREVLTTPVMLSRTATATTLGAVMKYHAGQKPGEFPCTFFPIRNEGFFETDSKVPGFVKQSYVNAWDGTGFVTDSATVRGYPICPQFYLTWVLEQIYALAGYRLGGDWIADPEVQRLVILNQTAIDRPALFSLFSVPVVPGQHLPGLSVGDFLKAIKQRFGLMMSFDGNRRTVTLRRFVDVVRSRPQDLSAYVAGGYGIDASQNRGFRVVDATDANDELYRDSEGQTLPAPAVEIGSGVFDRQEVRLSAGTTQLSYEPAPGGGMWTVPTMRQPGNMLDNAYAESDRFPETPRPGEPLQLKNDVELRIVSYRGLVANSRGALYPLGTPDVRDGRQDVVGSQAATLTGRYGLWRNVLRALYHFRDQTRPVTVPLDLPTAVYTSLRPYEPIALSLSGQARRAYLIEKIQAESPGVSGIMPCKLELLSLPDGIEVPAEVDEPIVWLSLTYVGRLATIGGVGNREYHVQITVHVWANAQKTLPAVATNLPVTMRRKKTWRTDLADYVPAKPYEETLKTYYVSGQQTVIETDWLTERAYNGSPRELFFTNFQLDPGEGYNIVP